MRTEAELRKMKEAKENELLKLQKKWISTYRTDVEIEFIKNDIALIRWCLKEPFVE